MAKNSIFKYILFTIFTIHCIGCKLPNNLHKSTSIKIPEAYRRSLDSINSTHVGFKNFFTDPYLQTLIDSALANNQELNIILQEINIAKNEIRARKGDYLPFLNIGGGAGVEREGRYTRLGSIDANTDIEPNKPIPDPLPNYTMGINASWELDVWRKLRNLKKAAMLRYLATSEGKNFTITNIVADIAHSYYELIALDNQVEILKNNIEIQKNALEIVKQLKTGAKVTELAVRRFEAELAKNQSRQFSILQNIIETENRINFLVGRFPQTVQRNSKSFIDIIPNAIQVGLPSQLLQNRMDIRKAEQQVAAARLDVKAAKANFYPSLRITGGIGYQAFNPQFLLNPKSLMYSIGGDLIAPLINRNAIKAYYYSANARQIQSLYNYEQTILRAYIEVANQMANIENLNNSYNLKSTQVQALTRSIDISIGLFQSARADYMEVMLTQRDALESKFDLIETKKQQMHAMVDMYQALGGGWK